MGASSYNWRTGIYDSGYIDPEMHPSTLGWENDRYFRPFKDIKKTQQLLKFFNLYGGEITGKWDRDTDTAWMNFVNSELDDLYNEDYAEEVRALLGSTYVAYPSQIYYGTPSLLNQKSTSNVLSVASNTAASTPSSSNVTYNVRTGRFTGGDLNGKSWQLVRSLVMGSATVWSDAKFREWCKKNNITIKKLGGKLIPKYRFNTLS